MKTQPLPYSNSWHSYFKVADTSPNPDPNPNPNPNPNLISYFKVADISRTSLQLDRCSGWNHIGVPHGEG